MQNNDLIKAVTNIDFHPAILDDDVQLNTYTKFPLSQLSAMGLSFEPLVQAVSSISGHGGSGIYMAHVPPGTHMAAFRDGSGLLGSLLDNATNQVGAGQARFTQIPFNPTMFFVASVASSIVQKLDRCIEVGEEILAYFDKQDKADAIGDITFLTDTLNDYKFKCGNKRQIEGSLSVVLEIRRRAEQLISKHTASISEIVDNKSKGHSDNDRVKTCNKLIVYLRNYQLSLYTLAFSSFIEVILEENFDKDYLETINNKLIEYARTYRTIYTDCYEYIDSRINASFKKNVLKGLSAISKFSGEAIAKVPVISKGQVDETLIEASKHLNDAVSNHGKNIMEQLIKTRDCNVLPFVNNITSIIHMSETPLKILFDKDNVYIKGNEA